MELTGQTLEILLKLRIKVVSIYAFAIDNFLRSQDEVDALMELAQARLWELCGHGQVCFSRTVEDDGLTAQRLARQARCEVEVHRAEGDVA